MIFLKKKLLFLILLLFPLSSINAGGNIPFMFMPKKKDCVPGSFTSLGTLKVIETVTVDSTNSECTFTITIKAAGGMNGTAAGGAGGGTYFKWKPGGTTGTLGIIVGISHGDWDYTSGGIKNTFGGGGGGSTTGYPSGSGGGASALKLNSTVLVVVGGGGGGSGIAGSTGGNGRGLNYSGMAGSSSGVISAGQGANGSTGGIGGSVTCGSSSYTPSSGGSTGQNGTGGGAFYYPGQGDVNFNIGGGGRGGDCGLSASAGGGGGYAGGGGGGHKTVAGGPPYTVLETSGGGGGSGYLNTAVVESGATEVAGAPSNTDGSIIITWN